MDSAAYSLQTTSQNLPTEVWSSVTTNDVHSEKNTVRLENIEEPSIFPSIHNWYVLNRIDKPFDAADYS